MGTYTSTFTCKCAHSSVWMIKMSLRLNFPSRRTHKGLRVMTKKIPLWILTKCCPHIEKTPMCRVLLADFIYHPNCGWSESLVGGKGLIDWANFAHSYLRIFLVKLSIIAYNKTLRSWVIFFYELPFGRGETHYHRFNWHAVPYFIQQMDAAAKRLVIRLLPQHPGSWENAVLSKS